MSTAPARSLRRHTARGTLVNSAFTVGLTTLGLARGFIVAGFLDASDYGVWGILVIGIGGLLWFKNVGISDKYVQQDDADQEVAFQKAFTLESIFTAIFTVVLVSLTPVVALVYGRPEVVVPALVLCLSVPALALQSPIWIHYRSMDFMRQRTLLALDPLLAFVVTIALAVAGFGYWSMVIGTVAGSWAAAIGAIAGSPYALRWRYDRGTMTEYVRFSWPIFYSASTRFVVAQAGILIGSRTLGLAEVGYITLASQIAQYANRLDDILAQTLYPAICRVKDRTDVLYETFVKSNRLALMWGVPFGLGVTLFVGDLVHFGIGGARWGGAVGLIQVFGLIAAVYHLGYNWDDYFRARGDTGPMATWATLNLITVLVGTIPLMLWLGLDGFAIGMALSAVVSVGGRFYFLTRLFDGLSMARHVVRALAPSVPAVGVVLLMRLAEGAPRTALIASVEVFVYVTVTILATWALERPLLREMIGYLRRRGTAPATPRPA